MNQVIKVLLRALACDLMTVFFSRDYQIKAEAVKRYRHTLQHVSKSLQNEKQHALMAVKQNGFALVHASELQNYRKVVMAAVQQKGCALINASKALRNEKEIMHQDFKK